jgi:hypothetical protein
MLIESKPILNTAFLTNSSLFTSAIQQHRSSSLLFKDLNNRYDNADYLFKNISL